MYASFVPKKIIIIKDINFQIHLFHSDNIKIARRVAQYKYKVHTNQYQQSQEANTKKTNSQNRTFSSDTPQSSASLNRVKVGNTNNSSNKHS